MWSKFDRWTATQSVKPWRDPCHWSNKAIRGLHCCFWMEKAGLYQWIPVNSSTLNANNIYEIHTKKHMIIFTFRQPGWFSNTLFGLPFHLHTPQGRWASQLRTTPQKVLNIDANCPWEVRNRNSDSGMSSYFFVMFHANSVTSWINVSC